MLSENLCLYNARRKFAADGHCYEYIIFNRTVFNPEGLEVADDWGERVFAPSADVGREANSERDTDDARRARRRALRTLTDHVQATPDLNCFVTLTLDGGKVDRYDYQAIIRKYNAFLSNTVQRRGLKYVLVPELHKDGAIHFHGLTNDVWRTTDSGLKSRSGGAIMNIDDYKYGYSTLVRIDENREAVCRYVTKYITKDSQKVGGRYILAGGKLAKPHIEYDRVDITQFQGYTVQISEGLCCKLVDVNTLLTF